MFEKLKQRWGIASNFQVIIILIVFAVTGSSTLFVKEWAFDLFSITADTSLWIKIPLYIIIIFPAYQLLLLIFAALFGQFQFFWNFEKKMLRRFRPKKINKTVVIGLILSLFLNTTIAMTNKIEKATLGGGCFWCTEAVYKNLKGVKNVLPGYSGGELQNPTYNEVCTGVTGHAEVVQIDYNPELISFKEILEVFFAVHDPTTLNRQGADAGTHYRSVIFYHTKEQKKDAEDVIRELNNREVFDNPVVTEVTAFDKFYVAEDYHKNYFANNPNQSYCQFVVAPKVKKFKKIFKEKLK